MVEGILEFGQTCLLRVLHKWCAFCCQGRVFTSVQKDEWTVESFLNVCLEKVMSDVC